MRDDFVETLRDCANALGEILPRDHPYRKIVERANRLLDRHDARIGVNDAPSSESEPGQWLITPRNGGKPYTSTVGPDSWELRECDIRWIPEAPPLQGKP